MPDLSGIRRWAGAAALTITVVALCVAAGLWQWERAEDRNAAIAVVRENYTAEPVPLDRVLGSGAVVAEDLVWRPVTVRGRYLPESTVLLRNRPVGSNPGFHVLTPFAVGQGAHAGTVLVVDRGWVPTGADSSTTDVSPPVPAGEVELVVRLRADEAPSGRPAPEGQVQAISVADVRAAAPVPWPAGEAVAGYGALVSEDGERPAGLGRLAEPSTDPGSHLSYALQWFVFAVGAVIAAVVLARRERLPDDQPAVRRRRTSAEDEEDALLDAQEGR